MAHAVFDNTKISGIACAVPKNIERCMDNMGPLTIEEVEKFVEHTGVYQRHISTELQTASDLCYVAAEKLIATKGYDKSNFDALIFVSQTADYLQPATSHILHHRLGLNVECMAFDINLGCSGYVYGLHVVASILGNGNYKRILLLVGERERYNPENEHKDHLLSGDAGSATIVETGEGVIKTLMRSDGSGYPALIIAGGSTRNPIKNTDDYYKETISRMDGQAVLGFTIRRVPKAISDFLELYHTSLDEYNYCILHQANLFIINYLAKKAKVPEAKLPISIDRYGNTSCTTIPLTIADLCERENVPETMNLLAAGYGIGLSWGVASFSVKKNDVLPIITTDDYYKEAYRG